MADEPDLAAAEFVLGTLDPEERRAFLLRLAREPALAEAVSAWRERLMPLGLTARDIPASPALWPRIESAIADGRPAVANDNRRVGGWRAGAIAASLLALVMSGIVLRQASEGPMAMRGSVAALTSQGEPPAVFVAYDKPHRMLKIMPMAIVPETGRSLQLWLFAGKAAPESMGILKLGMPPMIRQMPLDPAVGTIFAVSVEPIGGSPTGLPTGRIAWSGKMMPVSPET